MSKYIWVIEENSAGYYYPIYGESYYYKKTAEKQKQIFQDANPKLKFRIRKYISEA